jgi:ankyrin repeat protein
LKLVLAAGGDPNRIVTTYPRNTALVFAITQRNWAAADVLIEMDAGINISTSQGVHQTPIQAAAQEGNIMLVKRLLDLGVDVNAAPAPKNGATVLQISTIMGFYGIASLLLEAGADVSAAKATKNGRTTLEGAAEHGRIDMITFLVNARTRIVGEGSEQYERARELAAKNGHNAFETVFGDIA